MVEGVISTQSAGDMRDMEFHILQAMGVRGAFPENLLNLDAKLWVLMANKRNVNLYLSLDHPLYV